MELGNPLPEIFSEQALNQEVPFISGDISKLTYENGALLSPALNVWEPDVCLHMPEFLLQN